MLRRWLQPRLYHIFSPVEVSDCGEKPAVLRVGLVLRFTSFYESKCLACMYVCALYVHCVCTVCAWYPLKAEGAVGSPGA